MDSRNRSFSTWKMSALFTARTALLLLLTVFVMVCSPALAEDFVLRNGIKFCDSMSDVISKETLGIYSSTEDGFIDTPYVVITNKGEIAGIINSYIEYYFDSDKQLKEIFYYFPDMPALLEYVNVDYFNSIDDVLTSKYGSPRSQNPDDVFVLTSYNFNAASILTSMYSETGGYGVFDNYSEWIVDCGEYKVKIDHIEFCMGKSYSEAKSYHNISYFYFTDADVAAAEQKAIDKLNDAASDL